jgi:hypothetical protein
MLLGPLAPLRWATSLRFIDSATYLEARIFWFRVIISQFGLTIAGFLGLKPFKLHNYAAVALGILGLLGIGGGVPDLFEVFSSPIGSFYYFHFAFLLALTCVLISATISVGTSRGLPKIIKDSTPAAFGGRRSISATSRRYLIPSDFLSPRYVLRCLFPKCVWVGWCAPTHEKEGLTEQPEVPPSCSFH